MARLLVETFVNNTSMRGFGKCYRTKFAFLRFVWALYIIGMLITLCASCYFLIAEYAQFYTTMQEQELLYDYTDFPAVTVCSQRPLGKHATNLWKNGSILSPSTLSNSMRQSMLKSYRAGNHYTSKDLFFADKLTTYYQNLNTSDTFKIGLTAHDMIIFCMQRHTKNSNPSVSHDEICKYHIKHVRHPVYLNCFEIKLEKEDSSEIYSISLILQAGYRGDESDSSFKEHSQVHDLFTQVVGHRLTLHRPGIYPEIDRYGFNIPVQSSTEVKYQITSKEMLNIGPHTHCMYSNLLSKHRVCDLNHYYYYSYDACVSEQIGKEILKHCHCVSYFHLIGSPPTVDKPYCFQYSSDNIEAMGKRLNCVRNIKLKDTISKLSQTSCLKECNVTFYKVQVNPSTWLPTRWQLNWVVKVSRAWDTIEEEEDNDSSKRQHAENVLLTFMQAKNVSALHDVDSDFKRTFPIELDRLSLVTISRQSYNTIVKKETLQITLSALLARIGGLGSLTIGCTLALGFELVEYVFLLFSTLRSNKRDKKQERKCENNSETLPLSTIDANKNF